MTVDFTIPTLRLRGGLNSREHWRARKGRVEKERWLTTLFFREAWAKVPPPDRILPMAIQIHRVGKGTMDDDNLAGACKGVRDAIAKCLRMDDGDPQLHWLYSQEKGPRYAVKVRISTNARVRQIVEAQETLSDLHPQPDRGTAPGAGVGAGQQSEELADPPKAPT